MHTEHQSDQSGNGFVQRRQYHLLENLLASPKSLPLPLVSLVLLFICVFWGEAFGCCCCYCCCYCYCYCSTRTQPPTPEAVTPNGVKGGVPSSVVRS